MFLRALLLGCAVLGLAAAEPGFQKSGKGPGVILIHGFAGNKEVWAAVAAELSRDHTVLSVDLPGSGGTSGPAMIEGHADFGAIAKSLSALVRKEGLAPCLVVGHSMGGPIAARTVLEDPAAFRGVLLVDSFLGSIPASYFEATRAGLGKDPQQALSAFLGPMTASEAQKQRLVTEGLRVPSTILQAYLGGMSSDPLQGRQAELRVPVLQLAAGPRETDPAKEAARLAMFGFRGLPAFRLIHFPKAKHWIMWDEPEAFMVALRAFEAGLVR